MKYYWYINEKCNEDVHSEIAEVHDDGRVYFTGDSRVYLKKELKGNFKLIQFKENIK